MGRVLSAQGLGCGTSHVKLDEVTLLAGTWTELYLLRFNATIARPGRIIPSQNFAFHRNIFGSLGASGWIAKLSTLRRCTNTTPSLNSWLKKAVVRHQMVEIVHWLKS